MWIVTREVNEYNQAGEYFCCAYLEKPSFQELRDKLKLDDIAAGTLTRGGGRQDSENEWFYLRELKEGEML